MFWRKKEPPKEAPVVLKPVLVATAPYITEWQKEGATSETTNHVAMFWTNDANQRWVNTSSGGTATDLDYLTRHRALHGDMMNWKNHAKLPAHAKKVDLPEDLREISSSLYKHLKYNGA